MPIASGGPASYDAGKKIKGRKRHIAVDVEGTPIMIEVHTVEVQDRDGAPAVILGMLEKAPEVTKLWADGTGVTTLKQSGKTAITNSDSSSKNIARDAWNLPADFRAFRQLQDSLYQLIDEDMPDHYFGAVGHEGEEPSADKVRPCRAEF